MIRNLQRGSTMRRKLVKVSLGILAIITVLSIVGSILGEDEPEAAPQANTAPIQEPTLIPASPSPNTAPTATSEPPTAIPEPTPTPEPIRLNGSGNYATDPVAIPFAVAVVIMGHSGDGHFAVTAYADNGQKLLANDIGGYFGKNWLPAGQYIFDISANGAWTITLTSIAFDDHLAEQGFKGSAQDVSSVFVPPGIKVWEYYHRGDGHFAVVAVCAGGNVLVANEIGVVSGSTVVNFREGPCFFEVSANGEFGIEPRQ